MCEKKGLSLPPKNEELKREEKESLIGESLTLRLHFKDCDGEVEELKVNSSTEVGFVKLQIANARQIQAKNIRIFFNGKNMMNPMSLCDHPGVSPPSIDVDVYIHPEK
ncbi:Ubiquitin-related domain containing protein [Cryptosporidium felis]|nr:Ubiquitin-related domain containing protein [Cryptosporidium felis]